MKKILQVIKDYFLHLQERREQARENELRYLAKQYCCMDDRCCVPCIVVGSVPLYTVTDERTDLASFVVNIKDVEHVINSIRVKYVVAHKEK